ncbi:NUDIX hydrolase, partial [Amycolatopsis mediterranei]
MPGSDELVALYDQAGSVVGTTRRARLRREGLWHAAGVVLVRSGDGSAVYVHLRTPGKDVFPSTWDCWAGGVV